MLTSSPSAHYHPFQLLHPPPDGHHGLHNQQDCVVRFSDTECVSALAENDGSCSCHPRTVVPNRPTARPFDCTEANNACLNAWLLQESVSSRFNTCSHCHMPCMTGLQVEIHLKEGANPKVVHTPAVILVHWHERIRHDLKRDEVFGVIDRVPHGEAVTWCYRTVVTRNRTTHHQGLSTFLD